ncbi:MAG: GNAT family N-acetyltransferase [Candidatus Freyarchaeum deiterrae]
MSSWFNWGPVSYTYITLELEMNRIPEINVPDDVKVRKYNPENDAGLLATLHNEIMKEFRDFAILTEDFLKKVSTNCSFIAEINEAPVGMGLCTVADTKKGRLGYIAEFCVIKNYRKKRVGSALLKNIFACFNANNVEKITCEVLDENNLTLLLLRDKLGFKEVERTTMISSGAPPDLYGQG